MNIVDYDIRLRRISSACGLPSYDDLRYALEFLVKAGEAEPITKENMDRLKHIVQRAGLWKLPLNKRHYDRCPRCNV